MRELLRRLSDKQLIAHRLTLVTTFSPAAKLLQQQQQQPIDAPTSRADVITDVTVTRQPIARPRHSARGVPETNLTPSACDSFDRPFDPVPAGRSPAVRAPSFALRAAVIHRSCADHTRAAWPRVAPACPCSRSAPPPCFYSAAVDVFLPARS